MNALNWPTLAACKGMDTTVFAPADMRNAAEAKIICTGCPVRTACLEAAMDEEGNESYLLRECVRGGLTPRERYVLHRSRAGLPVGRISEPKPETLEAPPCSADGCARAVRTHGMCHTHYSRLRAHGSVADIPKPARQREEEVRRLHATGLLDPEIAKHIGLTTESVRCIRKRLSLPPNQIGGHRLTAANAA